MEAIIDFTMPLLMLMLFHNWGKRSPLQNQNDLEMVEMNKTHEEPVYAKIPFLPKLFDHIYYTRSMF